MSLSRKTSHPQAKRGPSLPAADFRLLFESAHDPCLVLDPRLRIVAVNDSYLNATMTRREEIVGRNIFEVLPDNPHDPEATGVRNLTASLNRVLRDKVADAMPVQRYDVRKPPPERDVFEKRYWSPVSSPVFGPDNEIAYIIHRATDVSEFINLKQEGIAPEDLTDSLKDRCVRMEAEIYTRAREVAEVNLRLKQANEQIDIERERWRAAIEAIADEVWVCHREGGVTLINCPPAIATGAPDSQGMSLEKFLEDWEILTAGGQPQPKELSPLFKSLKGEIIRGEEIMRHRRTGKVRYRLFTSSPMRNAEGAITGAIAIMRDITELHEAQEALRQSEQRFASFMLHLPAAAWMKDLEGRYIYANAEAEQIFSLPLSALRGKSDIEVFPPETARQFVENDRRVITDGGSVRTIETLRQADGIDHQSVVSKFAVAGPDGKTQYIAGVAFDITDLRKAEEALRQSERRFHLMAETVPEMLFTSRPDGSHDYCSGRFYDYTGMQPNSCEGFGWTEALDPDAAGTLTSQWKERIASGKAFEMRFRLRAEDGSYRWFITRARPVRDDQGRMLKWFGACIDVDMLVRTQEALKKNRAELKAVIKELEAFSYSVSHDLRAPLRHVLKFSELLQQRVEEHADEKALAYIATISGAAKNMDKLIIDLLAFAAISRQELRMKKVALGAVVRGLVREMKEETKNRDIEWKVSELPDAYGEQSLLRLVFVNLITNAVKFTQARPRAVIEVGCTTGEGEDTFFVKDNGVGFDMKQAGRLFGVFQRLHPGKEFEGTGIGLANVRRIIERHGGRVWAEGEEGKGASFYFTLPRNRPEDSA